MKNCDIKDITLHSKGAEKIQWAAQYMPLLGSIKKRFIEEQPFHGQKIAISIHLEAKTANLAYLLRAGGADVWCTGCNPLSTQDEIAAALAHDGFPVFAIRGVDAEGYNNHILSVLSCKPDLILDDGGDILAAAIQNVALAKNIKGGTEETTTGVVRMRMLDKQGLLPFAMIAVNDAKCKHLFDNRYGTGQSVVDSIMRNTNLLLAGKRVVIAGYGWCSRGIAMRANGLGAKVIITEVDPVRALEAAMDGYEVMRMTDAAPIGDIFITATGCKDVIVKEHLEKMKDGAILANAGHFDVEINIKHLESLTESITKQRENIKGYRLYDGRVLNLIADGRLLNIAAADGHPVEIMDMSFAVQALCLEYLAKSQTLPPNVFTVPEEIDNVVAYLKLEKMGMSIDTLSDEQAVYTGKK